MTSVKNIAKAAIVAAVLGCGLAVAPGVAAADAWSAVEIDVRTTDPGDWPWEILPIPPR